MNASTSSRFALSMLAALTFAACSADNGGTGDGSTRRDASMEAGDGATDGHIGDFDVSPPDQSRQQQIALRGAYGHAQDSERCVERDRAADPQRADRVGDRESLQGAIWPQQPADQHQQRKSR